MHDIDRTQMEYTPEAGFESEQFEFGGIVVRRGRGLQRSRRNAARVRAARRQHRRRARSVPRQPDQEGGIGAGAAVRSPIGQAVGGVLKGVAKKALPLAGGALGGYIGGPLGAKIGSGLASAAGSALGLEGEIAGAGGPRVRRCQAVRPPRGRHGEERGDGAGGGEPARGRAGGGDQRGATVRCQVSSAVGAVRALPAGAGRGQSGRWVRRGEQIVLLRRLSERALMSPFAAWMLTQEARALLTRLGRVRPFALLEPMVPAADLLPRAQSRHRATTLSVGRREPASVRSSGFIAWLRGPGRRASDAQAQRRFTFLRLRFNAALTQFDLFSDVITQRSEHETGRLAVRARRVCGRRAGAARRLLRGAAGRSAISIAGRARRFGARARACRAAAAIRWRSSACRANAWSAAASPRRWCTRSATRRRRCSISSASLRPVLRGMQRERQADDRSAWQLWERWISEIVADFWAVARVGIASTLGLIAVVSLPRAFVFRIDLDDPHPVPWIRVMLSCAIGEALLPASAVGSGSPRSGSRSIRSHGLDAGRRQLLRAAARHDAGLRGAADPSPARGVARAHAHRGAASWRAPAGAACAALSQLVAPPARRCTRASLAGVRGHRPGASRRAASARGREAVAGEAADSLGACAARSTARSCAAALRAPVAAALSARGRDTRTLTAMVQREQ